MRCLSNNFLWLGRGDQRRRHRRHPGLLQPGRAAGHGGTDVSQHAYIDNVVIASSYIGPINTGTVDTTPPANLSVQPP